jgi:hypothetical protein
MRALRHLQSVGPIGIAAIGKPGSFDVFSSFCATWYTEEDGVFAATLWGLVFYDRTYIGCVTLAKGKISQVNPRYLEQF